MIGSSLLRYQDNQRYILWDVETEGLSLFHSRPWQIAYAICTNREIESINVRYPLWTDLNVGEEAARITRFDRKAYLAQAEPANEVLKDFETLIYDPSYLSIGHNILGYDNYVLQTWRRLCGRSEDWSYTDRTIDTLCLSRAYRFQIVPDHSDIVAWQYKMLTQRSKAKGMGASLGAMAREFNVDYDEHKAHDAEYDARCNHQVFNRLLWSVEI